MTWSHSAGDGSSTQRDVIEPNGTAVFGIEDSVGIDYRSSCQPFGNRSWSKPTKFVPRGHDRQRIGAGTGLERGSGTNEAWVTFRTSRQTVVRSRSRLPPAMPRPGAR